MAIFIKQLILAENGHFVNRLVGITSKNSGKTGGFKKGEERLGTDGEPSDFGGQNVQSPRAKSGQATLTPHIFGIKKQGVLNRTPFSGHTIKI